MHPSAASPHVAGQSPQESLARNECDVEQPETAAMHINDRKKRSIAKPRVFEPVERENRPGFAIHCGLSGGGNSLHLASSIDSRESDIHPMQSQRKDRCDKYDGTHRSNQNRRSRPYDRSNRNRESVSPVIHSATPTGAVTCLAAPDLSIEVTGS